MTFKRTLHADAPRFYAIFTVMILALVIIPGQNYASNRTKTDNQLSLTHGHSCALINNQVTCWGSNHFGERDVPKTLSNPYQLSVGGQDSCVLDDFYVTCWGISGFDIIGIKNAIDLSRNVFHACVIDELRLFCFGSGNYFGELDVPADLVNPRRVVAGVYHTCALDDEGVKCWGDDLMGATEVPQLNSPTQIVAGGSFTCALDLSGLKCWGTNDNGELDIPALVNPRQISAGYRHICALDDSGVHCWGANGSGQSDVPPLINPTHVAAGTHHSCALDGNETVCWGYNGWGQAEPDNGLIAEYFASKPTSSERAVCPAGVEKLDGQTTRQACLTSRPINKPGPISADITQQTTYSYTEKQAVVSIWSSEETFSSSDVRSNTSALRLDNAFENFSVGGF